MNNWFTVKVKYTKQLENGTFKRVSEPYLLSAVTFTDAEARIYEELGSLIRGEFEIVSITRTEIHDIFNYEDSDTWFKVKMTFVNEEDEKSKKVTQEFLVTAETGKDAYDRIQESLSTLMVSFELPEIKKTPIVDVFLVKENLDKVLSTNEFEDTSN